MTSVSQGPGVEHDLDAEEELAPGLAREVFDAERVEDVAKGCPPADLPVCERWRSKREGGVER